MACYVSPFPVGSPGHKSQRACALSKYLPATTFAEPASVLSRLKAAAVATEPSAVKEEKEIICAANVAIKALMFGHAEDILLEALQRNLQQPKLFLRLALLEQKRGDHMLVRRLFEMSLRANPTDAALLQAWGLFETKHGNTFRAVQLLLRSVALNPNNTPVLRWRQMNCAAEMYLRAMHSKNAVLASRRLRLCVTLAPCFVPAWISLSVVERSLNGPDAARRVIREGLTFCPANRDILTLWGLMESRLGNTVLATRLFRARDRIGRPTTRFQRGDAPATI